MNIKTTTAKNGQGVVLGDIQLELNILIFTMLVNMGFLKLTEVSTFIGQTVKTVATKDINVWHMIMVSSAVIFYMVYIFSIFIGVWQTFRKIDPKPAMLVALGAFFTVYSCVFLTSVSS